MRLYLIRHADTQIDPGVAAKQWQLSERGIERAENLAKHLDGSGIQAVICSMEPKAIQTAQILAALLDLNIETVEGLHEHERPLTTGTFASPEEFRERVKQFFEFPDRLVLGAESAEQCYQRFNRAILGVIKRHAGKTIAVVSHGTVLSLLLSRYNHLDPYPFWRALGMPACITVDIPGFTIHELWSPAE